MSDVRPQGCEDKLLALYRILTKSSGSKLFVEVLSQWLFLDETAHYAIEKT